MVSNRGPCSKSCSTPCATRSWTARSKQKRRRWPWLTACWRRRKVSSGALGFPEAIADAADGFDEFLFAAQFAAQGFDVDVNGPFQDDGPLADGHIHELGSGKSSSRLAQHAFEQAKFRGGQVQVHAA